MAFLEETGNRSTIYFSTKVPFYPQVEMAVLALGLACH